MILYSTPNCPKCKILKDLLDKKEEPYATCQDVSYMIEMGISSVPVLEVQGELLDFQKALNYIRGEM